MTSIDRSVISRLPLFAGLGPADLDDVLRDARSLRVEKNAPVFEQGAEAVSFFLLLHGHVRAAKTTPDGHQMVVRYVSAGEIFGVAPAIGLSRYPATATAVADSVVLAWPSARWTELTSRYPTIAAGAMQTIGARLQEAHTRIIEMTTEEVERRVAHALLRLAKQAGRKIEKGIEIDFPISRQDLAEMTGTTLHSVSRVLSAWERSGLVEGGRQRIVLADPHGLFELANKPAD
jgi:CRP-like cAMP-binding protein